jgi:hypothetical protein
VREEIQTNKAAVGHKLIDLPGYVFRVFVTNRSESALEIWRLRPTNNLRPCVLRFSPAAQSLVEVGTIWFCTCPKTGVVTPAENPSSIAYIGLRQLLRSSIPQ